MTILASKPAITIDGNLSDWIASERIDYSDMPGYSLYAAQQGDYFDFAFSAPVQIGANTTFWFNTDLNAATGYQISAGPAGPSTTSPSTATAPRRSTPARQARSSCSAASRSPTRPITRRSSSPYPRRRIGNPGAIDTYYELTAAQFTVPPIITSQPYVAYADTGVTRTDPSMRIGIVYSDTTAANYFSATAYSDLIMAAENQAIQAGIPFDLLTEADLTDLVQARQLRRAGVPRRSPTSSPPM